jgi:hypothetical protein
MRSFLTNVKTGNVKGLGALQTRRAASRPEGGGVGLEAGVKLEEEFPSKNTKAQRGS